MLRVCITAPTYLWAAYFLIYCLISLGVILILHKTKVNFIYDNRVSKTNNEVRIRLIVRIMSLGGLPPFTGFLAKLMAVQTVINRIRIIIVATLVFSSLVSLFYYMRVAYSLLLNTTKRSIVVKTQTSSLSPVVTTTVVAGNVIAPLLVLLV